MTLLGKKEEPGTRPRFLRMLPCYFPIHSRWEEARGYVAPNYMDDRHRCQRYGLPQVGHCFYQFVYGFEGLLEARLFLVR